ncbi:MAG: protein kinase [Maioricimonas sp. JB045]
MSEKNSQATEGSGDSETSSSDRSAAGSDEPTCVEPLRQISDYQLIRKVGRGGMGEVYEALHVRLKRRVAVKILPQDRVPDSSKRRRFFREMEAAGKLTHPQIVQATDAGEVDGVPYLVMEFVDGADVAHLIRQFGPIPPLATLEAVEQAALGLEYVHQNGLVHRDVKPSNLLINRQGTVKVGDLGLAQFSQPPSQSDDLTSSDLLLGTVDYMAPEQAESPKLVDHRADIYSLGCCLHYLLVGPTVFTAPSRIDRLVAHRSQPPPPISEHCDYPVPESLERLYRWMLQKRPEDRPGSMRDVLSQLVACRQQLQRELDGLEAPVASPGAHRFPMDANLRDVVEVVFNGSDRVSSPFAKTTVVGMPKRPTQDRSSTLTLVGAALVLILSAIVFWGPGPVRPRQGETGAGTRSPAVSPAALTPSTVAGEEPEGADSVPTGIPTAHKGPIYALEFSEDGKLLVSAGDDGAARVWEFPTGKPRSELRDRDGELMIDVAVLPAGSRAVAASFSGRAYVWNWDENRVERTFDASLDHVESVALVDGTQVISSGVDDTIYMWDADTAYILASMPNDHQGGVRALAVSPDGRMLVAGDYEGNLSLWDLSTATQVATPSIGNEPMTIWSLDWSPDGSSIAIGGGISRRDGNRANGLVVLYDPERREVIQRLDGHINRVNAVRFSPDGRILYSVADNLKCWSVPDGELLQTHTIPGGELFGLAVSPDGNSVVVGASSGAVHFVPASGLGEPNPADPTP